MFRLVFKLFFLILLGFGIINVLMGNFHQVISIIMGGAMYFALSIDKTQLYERKTIKCFNRKSTR